MTISAGRKTIICSCVKFIDAVNGILNFIDSDPLIKLHVDPSLTDIQRDLSHKVYFSYNKGLIRIYITDGFRILVYSYSAESKELKINFSISRDELIKLNRASFSENVVFVILNNSLSINIGETNFQINTYKLEANLFDVFKQSLNEPLIAEVTLSGSELKHHLSLFGGTEDDNIIVDSENNRLSFVRGQTGYRDDIQCTVKGKSLKRFVNPALIYPFLLSQKEKDTVTIKFYETFIIELKVDGHDSLSYFLMPIVKKYN